MDPAVARPSGRAHDGAVSSGRSGAGFGRGLVAALGRGPTQGAIMGPHRGQAEHGQQQVGPQDDPGIACGVVAVRDELIDVSAGCAPQEGSHAEYRSQLHAQVRAAGEGEEPDEREPQAREGHLELERALRPSDDLGGEVAEHAVDHGVPGVADADAEQDEVVQDRPGDRGRGLLVVAARDAQPGGQHAENEQRDGEVDQQERDELGDHGILRWRGGGPRGPHRVDATTVAVGAVRDIRQPTYHHGVLICERAVARKSD